MKVCSHCHLQKEDTEFRMRREFRRKGGGPLLYLNNVCKSCDAVIANKYYSHHKDDPKFKDQWLKKSRDYYHLNKEKIKEKMKAKRQTPEYKAMMKAYREKNKEKIRTDSNRRNKKYLNKIKNDISDQYLKRLSLTAAYQVNSDRYKQKTNSYNLYEPSVLKQRIAINRIKNIIKTISANEK